MFSDFNFIICTLILLIIVDYGNRDSYVCANVTCMNLVPVHMTPMKLTTDFVRIELHIELRQAAYKGLFKFGILLLYINLRTYVGAKNK